MTKVHSLAATLGVLTCVLVGMLGGPAPGPVPDQKNISFDVFVDENGDGDFCTNIGELTFVMKHYTSGFHEGLVKCEKGAEFEIDNSDYMTEWSMQAPSIECVAIYAKGSDDSDSCSTDEDRTVWQGFGDYNISYDDFGDPDESDGDWTGTISFMVICEPLTNGSTEYDWGDIYAAPYNTNKSSWRMMYFNPNMEGSNGDWTFVECELR